MDPFTIVLGMATQILSSVMSDALTGQRSARRKELEERARQMAAAQQRDLSSADLEVLTRRILDEIHHLVDQHPDLEWKRNALRLVPPVPNVRPEDSADQLLLAERINRLKRIAEARRREAELAPRSAKVSAPPVKQRALPAESVPDVENAEPKPVAGPRSLDSFSKSEPAIPGAAAEIVGVAQYESTLPSGYWHSRIESMRTSVAANRTGDSARPAIDEQRGGPVSQGDPAPSVPEPRSEG